MQNVTLVWQCVLQAGCAARGATLHQQQDSSSGVLTMWHGFMTMYGNILTSVPRQVRVAEELEGKIPALVCYRRDEPHNTRDISSIMNPTGGAATTPSEPVLLYDGIHTAVP